MIGGSSEYLWAVSSPLRGSCGLPGRFSFPGIHPNDLTLGRFGDTMAGKDSPEPPEW